VYAFIALIFYYFYFAVLAVISIREMKIFLIALILISITLPLSAQDRAGLDMTLQPYTITGRDKLFKRNLRFAGYKTHRFRRNIASWFSFGTLNVKSEILKLGRVHLYKKSKARSVDIFRFELETDSGIVSRTECRAVLRKNETFRLLRPKDSAFFKINNVDFLEARIRPGNDTAQIWYMAAANLNGSEDAEQQGIIRCGDKEIRFIKTTRLLRDEPVGRDDMKSLFTSLNMVYLFTWNGEDVAAVSFKLMDKKFWCRDDLDSEIKTIIASAATLLCLRNDLYY
jgi:hypothetical protein